MFESKYKVFKNIDKFISDIKSKIEISNSYIDFLKKYNVVVFEENYCIDCDGNLLPIEIIFGFSKTKEEDLFAINSQYLNRIPKDCWAIAAINYGDLLCLKSSGEIFYWDHEINDLYFGEKANSYQEQNTNLKLIANDFNSLLSLISKIESDSDYNPDNDPYNNPSIPFPDEALASMIKYPKIFFMTAENILAIHLKKLELSEKGREVLAKFKEEGFL